MSNYSEVQCYVELGVLGEVEVLVDFEYYAGRSASLTEPAEAEVIEIGKMTFWLEGKMVDATGHEGLADAVEDQCWDYLRGRYEAEADYQYERMKEQRYET
jgi:hypothetical protein